MKNYKVSVSIFMVAAMFLGVGAQLAQAEGELTLIEITSGAPAECQLVSTQIAISGTATADAPPSTLVKYHVQIDWGDGNKNNQTEASSFTSGLNPDKGVQTRSFSGTHTYSAPGFYTISARIYYNTPPVTNSDAVKVDSIQVCIVVPLEINKTADTSLTRTYSWTIDKSADQDILTLADGELYKVNYDVMVDATFEDSNWTVSGTITVTNPYGNPEVTIESVLDEMSDPQSVVGLPIEVTCDGGDLPQILNGGETLNCTYTAELNGSVDQTNTVSVDTDINVLDNGAEAGVNFSEATVEEIDECVDVSDTNVGFLGIVCFNEASKNSRMPRQNFKDSVRKIDKNKLVSKVVRAPMHLKIRDQERPTQIGVPKKVGPRSGGRLRSLEVVL